MNHFEPVTPVWTGLNQSEQISTSLNQFLPVWSSFNQFQPVWTGFCHFGLVWTSLDRFEVSTCLNRFKPVWIDFNWFWLVWTSLDWFEVSTCLNRYEYKCNIYIYPFLHTTQFILYLLDIKSESTVQPFVLEILMSSFERDLSWKITISRGYLPPGGGEWDPLLKQKHYIDWIFPFQSKILSFAMIGFHQISLSTFIRNFALYCNVKKFEKFE